MGFQGVPRLFPIPPPSPLTCLLSVAFGSVSLSRSARPDSWMRHRVGRRIAANVHRRAKRLISREIHTVSPDNGVENFITPARDSAIERERGRRDEGDR